MGNTLYAAQSYNVNWKEIEDKFNEEREELKKFADSKKESCSQILNPTIKYLEDEIFPILINIMEEVLKEAIKTNSLRYQKTTFNGIDSITEKLWNLNPHHPERKENWTYIFDMEWVKGELEKRPRPYYPFSWIWSRDYAATKIQAYMRGYWIRRREEVQEMRQFWKAIKREKMGESLGELPEVMTASFPLYVKPKEDQVPEEN